MRSVDIPLLFRLWTHNVPSSEICERLSISRTKLFTLCDRHALPKRPRISRGVSSQDPTEDEIAERAAQIRESWTPAEAAKRSGLRPAPVEVRSYVFDGRDAVFHY